MKPGLAYSNYWKMMSGNATSIGFAIYDTSVQVPDDFDVSFINVKTSGNPCTVSVVDNDRDKFNPIKPKQCRIEIVTEQGIDFSLFTQGPDNRFYVEVLTSTNEIIFKGFLILRDIQQVFLPHAQILVLTASDCLGLLKDQPFLDANDINPSGKYKLSYFIANCLRKTGLTLPFQVVNNIREENKPAGHFYDEIYLDAKTFESEIGECEDCYTVLSKILGESCFLTQYKGEWWIYNVDEFDSNLVYVATFNATGVLTNQAAGTTYNKVIAKIDPATSTQTFGTTADYLIQSEREIGVVKETYRYQFPLEIPCNIDFSRGDVIDDSNPDEITYDVECWDQLWSNTSTDDPQTTGIYIKKHFINGYESQRYVVLELHATRFTFIMSEQIPVGARDKFDLSVSRRLSADVGGSGFYRDNHVQVRLYADDGTFYTHSSPTSLTTVREWVACDSTFRTNQKFFSIEGDASEDQTEAKGLYDGMSAEIPKDGYLKILVYRSSLFGATRHTYIDSVSFDYIPFINGSHAKYTGQYQRIYRTGGYLSKRDREVFISDSPKKL